jgi:hypothetical protein
LGFEISNTFPERQEKRKRMGRKRNHEEKKALNF